MDTSEALYLPRPEGRVAYSWGAAFWGGFYRSINKGRKAPWLEEHVASIVASLKRPGHPRSFRHIALQLDHVPVEKRLGEITAPMLSFVGDGDPDYKDPRAESEWLATLGRVEFIDQAGHYPHAQRPELVVPATIAFVAEVWANA